MSVLHIRLLGDMSVAVEHAEAIALDYDKVRALLAYLVVESERAHRRADLAVLLWPDRPLDRARQSLSQALYSLRCSLTTALPDSDYVLSNAQRLWWNGAAPYRLDVDQLRHAPTTWRQPEADIDLPALTAAAAAYSGEFLHGFTLRGCDEFDAWVTLQREHFHQIARETLRRLAEWHERQHEFDTALAYAQRRLALDRWQEEAHRQVMRLLEAMGQADAALAQYRECRAVLRSELGVVPSEATEFLHKQIAARRHRTHPLPALPAMLTPLLGREEELALITARLTTPTCRLVSLVGPGGSGKTHLALAAAHQMRSTFADGIVFVALAGITSPVEIVPTLARELSLQSGEREDVGQSVQEYLRRRNMLLVLDNMEHLTAGVPAITTLLQRAPSLKILATTRTVLHAAGEHVIQLGGLPLESAAAGATMPSDAAALFLYHMRRRRPAFAPDAQELQAIRTICRQVDGMPLAILLAAASTATVSLPELAQLLTDRDDVSVRPLDLLAADWPDLPPRQRSMRAVLAHSWQQLPTASQASFAALSVFQDGFTLDAARAVIGVDLREMRTLTDWSLVTPSQDGRFTLHELLRQYAAEQLQEQGRVAAVRSRHTGHFAAYCATQGAALCGTQQLTALSAFAADFANILAAWRAAVAAQDDAAVAGMTDGLCRYLEWRGLSAQGVDLCALALTRVHHASARARLITWKARFLDSTGQSTRARADLNALLHPSGHDGGQPGRDDDRAFALRTLGRLNIGVDTAAAQALLHESLRIYRRSGAQWETATTLVALGDLHVLTADYAQALAEADEAVHIAHTRGDRRLAAQALRVKSACYGMQGHLEEAADAARAGIDMLRALDDRRGVAETLMELASKFVYAGEFAQAIRLWDEMETTAQALGAWRLQAMADHFRGWSHTNLGHYALAEEYYLSADRLYGEAEDRHMQALDALGRGELRLALGEFQDAHALLRKAAQGLADVGQEDEAALAHSEIVLALRGLGRHAEAWEQLSALLGALRSTNAFPPLQNAVNACALLLSDAGEIEGAVELHALAAQHTYIARSVYRYDVIGRAIEARAQVLAPSRRAALEARGRQRDLYATIVELKEQYTKSRVRAGDESTAKSKVEPQINTDRHG